MISKTDAAILIRFLDDAAAFYRRHAANSKESDRSRLLGIMSKKLKRRLNYGSSNKKARATSCHV